MNKKFIIPFLIIFAFLLLAPSFALAAGSCACIKKNEPGKIYCVMPQNIKATTISDLICKNPSTYGIENYLEATVESCNYYAGDNCTGSQQYTPPTPAASAPPPQPTFTPIEPNLQINIPTVQFSKITQQGQYISIPYLADYIAGIYKYAVAVVSIIAIVMIMVGGLRWLTAGGNASAISSAKETISGATIGLLLVLGSYTVLYTINPDLVSFKALQIEYIKPDPIVVDWTAEDIKAAAGEATGSGSGNVPLFSQAKDPWKDICCGPNPAPPCKKTIAQAGCGLTSFSMVLKYYFPSQNVNPGAVSLLVPASSCSIGNLSASQISQWGSVALTTMNVNNLDKIKNLVSQGKPIVFNCHPCVGLDKTGTLSPRKYGGHLMVLTGYSNGTFSVNDPGGYYTSMTAEMLTNPCKFVSPSDIPKKAGDAIATCNKKDKNGDPVSPRPPGFWYIRPTGK